MTMTQRYAEMLRRHAGEMDATGTPPVKSEAIRQAARHMEDIARTLNSIARPWQPIETAPRDGAEVLVCRAYEDGKAEYAVAHNYDDGNGWRDMGDLGWAGMIHDDDNQPTHWMPLPPPPTNTNGRVTDGLGREGYCDPGNMELKTCPFCGATPSLLNRAAYEDTNPHPDYSAWDVACGTQGCYFEFGADYWHETESAAAELWNKRTNDAAKSPRAGQIDALVWLVSSIVALAKRILAEANATPEVQAGDWPAGQKWHQLGNTSQHAFMHRAREEAGIPHDGYRALINAAMDDNADELEDLWRELETAD